MPPGGPELEDHRQVTIEATTLEALITPTPVAPTAAPVFQPLSGAINLFFTIQPDGTPWGYIVDKQGREICPETGIPAVSINAQPGDLVLIQTNTPVFSLLLDCGTSPQSFAPCDFIAATPAELPQEIWVNKDGGSAYVNISGPGNWGNPRPGFEPQRYPADPVFRFVLSR